MRREQGMANVYAISASLSRRYDEGSATQTVGGGGGHCERMQGIRRGLAAERTASCRPSGSSLIHGAQRGQTFAPTGAWPAVACPAVSLVGQSGGPRRGPGSSYIIRRSWRVFSRIFCRGPSCRVSRSSVYSYLSTIAKRSL